MEHAVQPRLGDAHDGGRCPFLTRRLRRESRLRAETEVAKAWKVAPSRLHGREPRQVTTYEYDDHNRLIRSVTIREPEWTEQDLAEAIALLTVEADTCHGCGQPMSETTALDAEGGYTVDVIRCHACTELARARTVERPHPEALQFEVHRTWK